jgi:hypothetical protein
MDEIPLTVDLTQLRNVANRVERAADAIRKFRLPRLCEDDLAGSAVGGVASPALVATRLDDVLASMWGWATAARISASAFESAEQDSAARIDRS